MNRHDWNKGKARKTITEGGGKIMLDHLDWDRFNDVLCSICNKKMNSLDDNTRCIHITEKDFWNHNNPKPKKKAKRELNLDAVDVLLFTIMGVCVAMILWISVNLIIKAVS